MPRVLETRAITGTRSTTAVIAEKRKALRNEAVAEAVALAIAIYDERPKCSYARAVDEARATHPTAPRLMVLYELRSMRPKKHVGRGHAEAAE